MIRFVFYLIFFLISLALKRFSLFSFVYPLYTFCSFFTSFSFAAGIWMSFGLGFLQDLFSETSFFGFYSLIYTVVFIFVFYLKQYFNEEKLVAHGLIIWCFSFLTSLLELLLTPFNDPFLKIRIESIFSDLGIYPIIDALFGFVCIILPTHFFVQFIEEKKYHPLILLAKKILTKPLLKRIIK